MKQLDVALKTLILFASVSVLPYYLIFYQGLEPLYTIFGSVVLCVFLSAVWMVPQRRATSGAPQIPSQPVPTTSASTKPRSRLGYS
jgi:hypothetical protein